MNLLTRLPALTLLLAAAPLAFALSSVELDVNGRITPSACSVSLSDNGLVDHGRILATTLHPSEYTVLPNQQMGLSISCEGPVLFALVGIDNKRESSLAPDYFYGLGMNPHAPDERLGSVSALSPRGGACGPFVGLWHPLHYTGAPITPPQPAPGALRRFSSARPDDVRSSLA